MNATSQNATTRHQAGMTLIELSVVLLILIALASLLIPYVGSFLEKSSSSTGASTTAEVFNSISLYHSQQGGYPDNLDLLVDSAGAIDPTLDDYPQDPISGGQLMNWATVPPSRVANIIASLRAPGSSIKRVALSPHTGVTYNADGKAIDTNGNELNITFDPNFARFRDTGLSTATVKGFVTTLDGMFISICSNTAPYNQPNACTNGTNYGGTIGNMLGYQIPTGHAIIVLGVGSQNAAIGKTMSQPPVVFAATPTAQPHLVYARYLAAFDVDMEHAQYDEALKPAKLVGIVYGTSSMMFQSTGSAISGFYTGLKEQAM